MYKKLISILVLVAMIATLFVGCGKEKDPPILNADDVSEAIDNLSEGLSDAWDDAEGENHNPSSNEKLSKAEECALQFVFDLQQGNYEAAMASLGIEDTTFITAADLEWYIPRSDYSAVVGCEGELSVVSSQGGNLTDRVTVMAGNITVTVDTFLNDNNEWKAVVEGFYVGDWSIQVPGDVTVYINDVEVPKTLRTGFIDLQDMYKIPAVPNKVLTVKVVGTVFGDATQEVLPSFTTEPQKIWVTPSSENSDTMFGLLKDLLNKIHEDYEAGTTPADLSKYISSKADPQLAQRLWDSIHECYTWNDSLDPSDIRYTTVKGSPNVDNIDSFIAKYRTANIFILNVAVEKTWKEKYDGSGSTRVVGTIFVEYADGQLYIYDIPGDNFLSDRNDFTQSW